jgi:hypothetical protein
MKLVLRVRIRCRQDGVKVRDPVPRGKRWLATIASALQASIVHRDSHHRSNNPPLSSSETCVHLHADAEHFLSITAVVLPAPKARLTEPTCAGSRGDDFIVMTLSLHIGGI